MEPGPVVAALTKTAVVQVTVVAADVRDTVITGTPISGLPAFLTMENMVFSIKPAIPTLYSMWEISIRWQTTLWHKGLRPQRMVLL